MDPTDALGEAGMRSPVLDCLEAVHGPKLTDRLACARCRSSFAHALLSIVASDHTANSRIPGWRAACRLLYRH